MNIENDEQLFEKLRDFGLLLEISFCTNAKYKKINQMVLNWRKRDKNSEKKILSFFCIICDQFYEG